MSAKLSQLVSVIIATYNYASFISKAVDSVINQHFNGTVEIIVVDDGSEDDTEKVLAPYINQGLVKYFYQQNKGKAAATKKALEIASGEIIFNLDADDWFLPEKIQRTIDIFNQYPDVVHVASPAKIVKGGETSVVELVPEKWLEKPMNGMALLCSFFTDKVFFGSSSCFSARSAPLKNIVWDVGVDMYTDVWLLMEVLKTGNTFFIREPLSVWRAHGSNYSLSGTNKQVKYARLEKSSTTILELLYRLNYPKQLYKSYKLQHIIWQLMHKEDLGNKNLLDICRFFFSEVVSMKHRFTTLRNYNAHARLVPQTLLNLLKGK